MKKMKRQILPSTMNLAASSLLPWKPMDRILIPTSSKLASPSSISQRTLLLWNPVKKMLLPFPSQAASTANVWKARSSYSMTCMVKAPRFKWSWSLAATRMKKTLWTNLRFTLSTIYCAAVTLLEWRASPHVQKRAKSAFYPYLWSCWLLVCVFCRPLSTVSRIRSR